ncbi:MAG TPA: DHA2 family efflux MFS transporter permease subunit [Thermoleophilaceae bacterium]|nr:DHA2 family efflux MFS transporter permease subunit [Thermoleophilaceae bacterium]
MTDERRNPSSEFLYANKWRIFGVMMIGWAMSLLDVSIVNIAIPELQDELSTEITTVTWVINAYNIVFAILLVSMGRLADQFGRKRFFMIGMVVFTIGSALCAIAWSVEWLIGFRVIQGIGAGILAPLGFAMTVLVFPPHQRGRGLALIAVIALVSSALGPVLGGVLIEVASWEWIFLINIPFGILGIVLAWRWWPETWDLSAGRQVDVRGMVLLGAAVFCLTVALVEANPFDGHLALWLSLMQAAILLGAAFIWWERRAPNPMITPGLFANKQFRNANIGMLLFGAGAIGTLLLLSLVFTNLWGYEPIEAALALAVVPLCGLLAWPLVGRAADSRAPGELAKPALVLMAIGLVIVSFLPSTAGDVFAYLRILPGLILIGVGMGIGFPALNVGAMGAVAGPEVGLASGVLNTARQLGAAIGIALLIATFGGALHAHMSWFAEDEIEDIVDEWEIPAPEAGVVIQSTLHDYTGGTSDRFVARPGFDEAIIRETAGSAREGFAWAFRHAALLILSVLPLLGALRRTPAQAQAEFMAKMKAQQGQGPPLPDDGNGSDGGDGARGELAPEQPYTGGGR